MPFTEERVLCSSSEDSLLRERNPQGGTKGSVGRARQRAPEAGELMAFPREEVLPFWA